MPPRFEKFIRKLSKKQRQRVVLLVSNIMADQLTGLNIKPLRGHKGTYRCRVGMIRITFIRTSDGSRNIIHEINYRGSAYKKK